MVPYFDVMYFFFKCVLLNNLMKITLTRGKQVQMLRKRYKYIFLLICTKYFFFALRNFQVTVYRMEVIVIFTFIVVV